MNKILICIFTLFFVSCATKTVTIYKDVYVPVSCEVELIKRPMKTGKLAQDLQEILIYSLKIENMLFYCVGKENVEN